MTKVVSNKIQLVMCAHRLLCDLSGFCLLGSACTTDSPPDEDEDDEDDDDDEGAGVSRFSLLRYMLLYYASCSLGISV